VQHGRFGSHGAVARPAQHRGAPLSRLLTYEATGVVIDNGRDPSWEPTPITDVTTVGVDHYFAPLNPPGGERMTTTSTKVAVVGPCPGYAEVTR